MPKYPQPAEPLSRPQTLRTLPPPTQTPTPPQTHTPPHSPTSPKPLTPPPTPTPAAFAPHGAQSRRAHHSTAPVPAPDGSGARRNPPAAQSPSASIPSRLQYRPLRR